SVVCEPRRASDSLTPELPWMRQPRSVSICPTFVSRAAPDSPAARPSSRNHPASASNPLPRGSRSSTLATSSCGWSAAAGASCLGQRVLGLAQQPDFLRVLTECGDRPVEALPVGLADPPVRPPGGLG